MGTPVRFVAPFYGPVRAFYRCRGGTHVSGGQCGHAGGTVVDGSCYVVARRTALVGRPLANGSGYAYTVEPLLRRGRPG